MFSPFQILQDNYDHIYKFTGCIILLFFQVKITFLDIFLGYKDTIRIQTFVSK